MSDEKLLEQSLAVVEALYRQTSAKKIIWTETEDPRVFVTEFSGFTIKSKLIPDWDYPDKPDYSVEIINAESGKTLESISNMSLRPVLDRKTKEGLDPYSLLEQIHNLARRQALRVDAALESLLHSLAS